MIRLPNIIFLIVYLFFAIQISQKTKFKLLTFGFLTLYWYLIPGYFSQARGYGPSTSLVLIFLYQFLNKPNSVKTILSSIAVLLLASYAFLGLIPLVISACIYYFVFEIRSLIHFVNKNRFIVLGLFFGIVYISYLLFSVSSDGKPLYGAYNNSFLASTIGFYKDSFFLGHYDFGTVSKNMEAISSLYNNSSTSLIYFVVVYLCFIAFALYKKQRSKIKVSLVAIMCFTLLYLSSIIMNKPFITGRSLLPFFPVVVMSIVEIIEYFVSFINVIDLNGRYKRIISLLLFIGLLFNYKNTTEDKIFHILKKDKQEKIKDILTKEGWPPTKRYYIKKEELILKKIELKK